MTWREVPAHELRAGIIIANTGVVERVIAASKDLVTVALGPRKSDLRTFHPGDLPVVVWEP